MRRAGELGNLGLWPYSCPGGFDYGSPNLGTEPQCRRAPEIHRHMQGGGMSGGTEANPGSQSRPTGFRGEANILVDDLAASTSNFRQVMDQNLVVKMVPDQLPDDLRTFYDTFVEMLGTPADIGEDYAADGAPNGQRWAEIRYDADIPDMAAFRHSKNAQPFHTDESYVSSYAGIMLFYCDFAAPSGGETIFIDGRALVAQLRQDNPELLERLLTTDVVYRKAADFKRRPIIVLEADGRPNLNFNYFCADQSQAPDGLVLNEDFHQYLQHDLPNELVYSISLQPGESAAWRDEYVLHGRNAFEATKTNDRLIWKTGVTLTNNQ